MLAVPTLIGLFFGAAPAPAPLSASQLAARIDARVESRFKADAVTPAPRADDAGFLRRAHLDLTGRIPRPADVHEFLADRSRAKDADLIDRLLADPRHAHHMANLWRAELGAEIASEPQARLFQAGFERWLRERFRANVRYDVWVRELLTLPLPSLPNEAEPVLRDPTRSNPLAFYALKEAKPENLAASVTRTFLGVRLECAQCHDHPHAKWTRIEFWSQAAFFAGVRRQGNGMFAPLSESDGGKIVSPAGNRLVAARFLGATSAPKNGSRAELAAWMTSKANPFFARTAVNRLWAQLFGVGLVEPIDDFRDDNSCKDDSLLDLLAAAYADSGYDTAYLLRSLALTRAYRRSSARTHPSQDTSALPARMTVKALTGEQFFDSLAVATGYKDEDDRGQARQQFLTRFALAGPVGDPETSVQQALTLLNGRFLGRQTDPERGRVIKAISTMPGLDASQRIEALHLAALSRKPMAEEMSRLRRYLADGEREADRLADIFWVLLNSAEFRLNH